MRKVKITSDKIEEIFTLMNFFKPNELIHPEYQHLKEFDFPHTLYVTLGAIKESVFINRVKKFDKLHKNLLTVEVLESMFDESGFLDKDVLKKLHPARNYNN